MAYSSYFTIFNCCHDSLILTFTVTSTWLDGDRYKSAEIDVTNNPLLISYNNMDDSPSPSHYKDPQSDLASRSKYSTNPPRSILSIANIQAQVRPTTCQQRLTTHHARPSICQYLSETKDNSYLDRVWKQKHRWDFFRQLHWKLVTRDWMTFSGRWPVQVPCWLSSPADFIPAAGPVSNRPPIRPYHPPQ